MSLNEEYRKKFKDLGVRYWAGDNLADHLDQKDIPALIDEASVEFEKVLDALLIDRETDPNSQGTARRLAKMYYNEIMSGRYRPAPDATAFPNDGENRYGGLLTVRTEIKSMCSHHHQPVRGVAYIGIIATDKLIGLSKYSRIAQWCARRGTLQEELCNDIVRELNKATGSPNIAVHLNLSHGCCENRGIGAYDSSTQTTVLSGRFWEDQIKHEFLQNVQIQELKR